VSIDQTPNTAKFRRAPEADWLFRFYSDLGLLSVFFVLFAFVVLGLVSLVVSQEIG